MPIAHILIVTTMATTQVATATASFPPRIWPVVAMQRVDSLKACEDLARNIQDMTAPRNAGAHVSEVKTRCRPASQ